MLHDKFTRVKPQTLAGCSTTCDCFDVDPSVDSSALESSLLDSSCASARIAEHSKCVGDDRDCQANRLRGQS